MILDGIDAEEHLAGDVLVARRCRVRIAGLVRPAQRDQDLPLRLGEVLDLRQCEPEEVTAVEPSLGARNSTIVLPTTSTSPSASRRRWVMRFPLTNVPLRDRPSSLTVQSSPINVELGVGP